MTAKFIPDRPDSSRVGIREIPYFENSSEEKVAGHATTKKIGTLQEEIVDVLARMGAAMPRFHSGKYQVGKHLRYGYEIEFSLGNALGKINVAALPIKKETAKRKEMALRQALFLVRDMLLAEYHSMMYRPGSAPLIPYLIGPDGRTVTEMIAESGDFGLFLGSGSEISDVVDGDVIEAQS